MMRSLMDDLRYSLRTLGNSPVFTTIALLTLALGIGANTTVFSLTYAVMLRALPVEHPDRLVLLTYDTRDRAGKKRSSGLSQPLIEDLERKQSVFSGIMTWRGTALTLTENGDSRLIQGAVASGDTFEVLGIRPYLGRGITPADDHEGGGPNGWAAVLGYRYWQTHFHADPQMLGRSITVEGIAATVVGIGPPNFESAENGSRADIILPLEFDRILMGKPQVGMMMYLVLGRLKPGVTLGQVRAQVAGLSPTIIAENDAQFLLRRGFFAGGIISAATGEFGRFSAASDLRDPLLILEALVGAVLLICCCNIAGLLGARMAARRHELAVRSALGASRRRLLRQLVVESLVLCGLGALLALLLTDWSAPLLLRALLPKASNIAGPNYVSLNLSPDWRLVLFACVVAFASALLVALLPGFRATRVDVARDLSAGSRQLAGGRSRGDGWIVSGQVAFASLLIVAAGLFASTVYHLLSVNPGFQTSGVLLVPTDIHRIATTPKAAASLYERMLDRLRDSPGIEAASSEEIPMLGDWTASAHYASLLPDGTVREDKDLYFNSVGAAYFSTTGTRVLAGRDVTDHDRDGKHMVCALNRSAAQFFFPQGNAVGSSVHDYSENKLGIPCEIVAIVEDTKFTSLKQAPPRVIYVTLMEAPDFGVDVGRIYLVLRTNNPDSAAAAARQVLRELAPGAPQLAPITMDEQLLDSIGRERAMAILAASFAALALLLTALGLYGTLSYQVNGRAREIAIRMAVGADAGDVVRMVVRRAMVLTLVGLVAGLGAAAFAGPLVKSMLFGVRPLNPQVLAGAAVLLIAIAAVASLMPARRATKVDPMLALRAE